MRELSHAEKDFIVHWGEMGERWGINRTVAQIHALLHISAQPLTAEEISDALAVARSNVSMSIRELQSWGLVRAAHVFGDRRQHYQSVKDVWEMFRIIVDERKKREIDPTLAVLAQCLTKLERGDGGTVYARERLQELQEFFHALDAAYRELREVPVPTVRRLVRVRGMIRRLLGAKASG